MNYDRMNYDRMNHTVMRFIIHIMNQIHTVIIHIMNQIIHIMRDSYGHMTVLIPSTDV